MVLIVQLGEAGIAVSCSAMTMFRALDVNGLDWRAAMAVSSDSVVLAVVLMSVVEVESMVETEARSEDRKCRRESGEVSM